jgi:hypothetical protein
MRFLFELVGFEVVADYGDFRGRATRLRPRAGLGSEARRRLSVVPPGDRLFLSLLGP